MLYRRRNELPELDASPETSQRVLEPIERVSEVLFGLIMVLTFTGSLSAAESGRAEVRTMLVGAVGCNIAWGVIDGIMYLMDCLAERASKIRTVSSIRGARTDQEAARIIADALPPVVAAVLDPAKMKEIQSALVRIPDLPTRVRLDWSDWLGAIAVFLLVFASTIPVSLPFVFLSDAMVALRVSNVIAIAMMFVTGYAFGKLSGYHPLIMAISMVVVGSVVVAMTIALGG